MAARVKALLILEGATGLYVLAKSHAGCADVDVDLAFSRFANATPANGRAPSAFCVNAVLSSPCDLARVF